jgi:Lon protease-like protein
VDVLTDFSGLAPLFPLSAPSLFPTLTQPFQIFEPRYREMTAQALEGDKLIAMAVLKPGFGPLYGTKTVPIEPIACLGQITFDQRLDDGRYVLMLRGLCRVRIVEEVAGDDPFRIGRMEILPDVAACHPAAHRECRRREMLELFQRLAGAEAWNPMLLPLLKENISFSTLCDFIAFASQMTTAESYAVLAQSDVDRRASLVLEHLRSRVKAQCAEPQDNMFPPAFSPN